MHDNDKGLSSNDQLVKEVANIVYQNAHFAAMSDKFDTEGQILGMRTGPGLEFQQVVEGVCEYIENNYDLEDKDCRVSEVNHSCQLIEV